MTVFAVSAPSPPLQVEPCTINIGHKESCHVHATVTAMKVLTPSAMASRSLDSAHATPGPLH
jgi:hypothetical protein